LCRSLCMSLVCRVTYLLVLLFFLVPATPVTYTLSLHDALPILVELLVVLVLIGTLVGLAVLGGGFAGPGRELRAEAERLAGLIGLLAEEAVLDNREYGLRIEPDQWQVLAYDGRRWTPWENRPPQRLPHGVEARLELEGRPLRLAGAKGPAASAPQVLILSSGELSPFRLQLIERRPDGLQLELASDGFNLPRVATLGAVR